jgi:murein DD-endopeptidase MepM/ murein hydrolase activator NlpD
MKQTLRLLLLLPLIGFGADMMTPAYYNGELKAEADTFLAVFQNVKFHHPLEDKRGNVPSFTAPAWGAFGAGKGPTRTEQHHPATDLKMDDVALYAAHDGVVATVRDAPKYRNYISITQIIKDAKGKELGKLVTLYGHVDLDLDEADGLSMNGKRVKAGDLISKNLWSGTRGGPHLHFEIRYYRPSDNGTEEFYGFRQAVPGAGDWPYGKWNPDVGYGYGDPKNHGLIF